MRHADTAMQTHSNEAHERYNHTASAAECCRLQPLICQSCDDMYADFSGHEAEWKGARGVVQVQRVQGEHEARHDHKGVGDGQVE